MFLVSISYNTMMCLSDYILHLLSAAWSYYIGNILHFRRTVNRGTAEPKSG